MNKKLLLLSLIFFAPQANAMLSSSVAENNNCLIIFHPSFPEELNTKIFEYATINSSAKSLHNAARIANTLTQINKSLKKYMSKNCFKIIKNHSQRFSCSDEDVALALRTKSADQRLNLQDSLSRLYTLDSYATAFSRFKKQNVDLNFTYGYNRETILVSRTKFPNSCNDCVIHLIENGANINIIDRGGNNACMIAIASAHNNYLFEVFFDHPNFQPNHQNHSGYTALTLLLSKSVTNEYYTIYCAAIKKLLERYADPEIPNNKGETPLSIAQRRYGAEIIKLIEEAIVKKHSQQST